MKTTANGKQADNCKNNENNNRVNIQALPAGEFGDLCYDYFGKGSVIVFGNTSDHAAQLEAIGGKYGDRLRYSALQNGRKWTEKQGRTAGYYFTTEQGKREAVQYVQRVNHAIFDRYEQSTEGGEHLKQKPADFKAGDRVRTIHGLGTVTEHTPKYNAAQSVCVKLDKSTYNYGWKGMPQTFIECRCDEITRYTEAEKSADQENEAKALAERIKNTLEQTGASAWADQVADKTILVTRHNGSMETLRVIFVDEENYITDDFKGVTAERVAEIIIGAREHDGKTLTASLTVVFGNREDYERGKQVFDSEGESRLWAGDWDDKRGAIEFCESGTLEETEREVREELDRLGFENYATIDGEEMWV